MTSLMYGFLHIEQKTGLQALYKSEFCQDTSMCLFIQLKRKQLEML